MSKTARGDTVLDERRTRFQTLVKPVGFGFISRGQGSQDLLSIQSQQAYWKDLETKHGEILSRCQSCSKEQDLIECQRLLKECEPASLAAELRIIREALLASAREDAFAEHIFLVCTIFGVLSTRTEHYLPCLKWLDDKVAEARKRDQHFSNLYPIHLLSTAEYSQYFRVMQRSQERTNIARQLLIALARGNWYRCARVYAEADVCEKVLMRVLFLKHMERFSATLSVSYHSIGTSWLNKLFEPFAAGFGELHMNKAVGDAFVFRAKKHR